MTTQTAEQLAAEMQRYGVVTMNRWATDGAAMLRSQAAEIERLKNSYQTGHNAGVAHHKQATDHIRAENESLRLDAERYRFMRDDPKYRSYSVSAIEWSGDPLKADTLIDAAMEATK